MAEWLCEREERSSKGIGTKAYLLGWETRPSPGKTEGKHGMNKKVGRKRNGNGNGVLSRGRVWKWQSGYVREKDG